jgi:hypothetical protein
MTALAMKQLSGTRSATWLLAFRTRSRACEIAVHGVCSIGERRSATARAGRVLMPVSDGYPRDGG